MGEPKTFASLTSSLLARKGDARPAMRRQNVGGGHLAFGHEDLGWNDMGHDVSAEQEHGQAGYRPYAGLSPMPGAHHANGQPAMPAVEEEAEADGVEALPPVIQQRQILAERVAEVESEADAEADGPAGEEAVSPPAHTATVAPHPAAVRRRKSKAAFTLRLDPERHLRLRLACAVANRSAQQLVIEALDSLMEQLPQVEELAGRVPRNRAAG